jgi:multicomponent K+:H+ antiporter subunit A
MWLWGMKLGNRGTLPVSSALCCSGRLAACALGTAWKAKYHRMTALIMLGGTGLCTVLTFLWFSAPDLALTQLVVEVATTVLILLGLRWLPKRTRICVRPIAPMPGPRHAACAIWCWR